MQYYKNYNNCNKSSGFTLIEVMVVVIIIGILAMLVVPKVVNRVDDSRVTKARVDIATLETNLDLYRIDNGVFPTTEQGLMALETKPTAPPVPMNWKGPYLKKLVNDPWGEPYQYRYPGIHNTNGDNVEIFSFGPKGRAAIDESGYIGNWDVK